MHAQLFESRLVTLILGALALAVGGWVVWAYAAGPSVDGVVERELSPEAWTSLVETAFEGRDAEAGAVRVVVFSDYGCPYCARLHDTVEALRSGDGWQVAYVHAPVFGEASIRAARAAECARQQGRFEAMHARLFERPERKDADFERMAQESGIPSVEDFRTCLGSESAAVRVDRDAALADRFGVRAVPVWVADGRVAVGAQPESVLRAVASQ
jgi:protein-disulfide isomerase